MPWNFLVTPSILPYISAFNIVLDASRELTLSFISFSSPLISSSMSYLIS